MIKLIWMTVSTNYTLVFEVGDMYMYHGNLILNYFQIIQRFVRFNFFTSFTVVSEMYRSLILSQ